MAHPKTFLEQEDQFVVSYELLYILQWLMTYERQAFSDLIQQAFVQGVQNVQELDGADQDEDTEYLQHSVIEFFSFLEAEIAHASQAESIRHIMHSNLLKTLDHIDPQIFDPVIVKESMVATAEKIRPKQHHLANDLFLKQLLKKWTPKKEKNKKHSQH